MRPLNTADVIRMCQIDQAELSAEAKRAAARAAFAAMTTAERRALAERNQMKMDSTGYKLNASAIAVHGPGARLQYKDGEQPEQQQPTEAEMDAAGIPFTWRP